MRNATKTVKPPPVLAGCRVIEYALRDRSVKYSGRSHLFYGGKEVGPVSRLAIGRDNERGALVLHCSRTWNVLGIARHAGIKEAKRRAERIYPGLSAKWLKTGVSKRQAKAYLDKALKGVECSFCGKRPDQIDQMVSKGNARICNVCVRDIAAMMSIE